jgi:hypothetical protein
MRWLVLMLLSLVVHGMPNAASAVSISLVPSNSSVNVGDSFTVAVEVAALAGAAVGAFDVSLSFDSARFALTGVTFSSVLGDIGAGEQLTDVVSGAASVSLGSVSLLEPALLAALQTDPLTIVSLTFQAVGAGAGAFGIDTVLLSDAFGAGLAVGNRTDATVDVVPEPVLALALGFALGAAAFARWRRA